jgi:bacillithiol biosynthesis cysteine-adding enzyme BshC
MLLHLALPASERAVSETCIPFSEIPHSTKLFLDYLYLPERVSEFYPRPANQSWLLDQAKRVQPDIARSQQVADVLQRQNEAFGADESTFRAIDSLRNGARAVVTGQQVGLFGGPFYSVLKAASALSAAEQLNKAGVPAVAVFWLATEDHDLDEVKHALIPSGPGTLAKLESTSRGKHSAPVGQVKFSAEIDKLAAEAADLLGDPEIAAWLRESYREGESFGSAFGKLFARMFRERGLILLDMLDPQLHQIATPVYVQALTDADAINRKLLERGKRLRDGGYHEQVRVTKESTLLFSIENGERKPIHVANGGFMIGAQKIEREELLGRIKSHPEDFSPTVFLRPIIQDYLLPTVTYFGGAAEVAYFAQLAVVYEHILGRVTPILPRLSATIVNQRMQRLLKRYNLSLTDLFDGTENLKELLGRRALPDNLKRSLDEAASALKDGIGAMTESLRSLDQTLVAAAEKASRKMQYQVERLRTKAARAELRRNELLERDAAELIAGLFPEKTLQERELAGVALLAANPGLLDRLLEAANRDCGAHQVINV